MPVSAAAYLDALADQDPKRKRPKAASFLDEPPPIRAEDFLDEENGMDPGAVAGRTRTALEYLKGMFRMKPEAEAAPLQPLTPTTFTPGVDRAPNPAGAGGTLPPISAPAENKTTTPEQVEPGSEMAFLQKGTMSFLSHRPDQAIAVWAEGLKKYPQNEKMRNSLASLMKSAPGGAAANPKAMEKYAEGMAAYEKGEYAAMKSSFAEADRLDPGNQWTKAAATHAIPENERQDLDPGDPTPITNFFSRMAPEAVKAVRMAFPAPDVTDAPETAAGVVKAAAGPILAPSAPIRSEGGKRLAGAAGSGVAGSAGSMSAAIPAAEAFLGVDTPIGRTAARVGKDLRKLSAELMPNDPGFAEKLASGAGSMALFMVPGAGTAKIVGMIPATARMATAIAPALATGVSTVLESATEAGGVYQDLIEKGVNRTEAGKAAFKDFWTNAIVIGLTNRFGVFSDKLNGLKKVLASAPLEGIQEGAQDILSEIAQAQAEKRPVNIEWNKVAESAGIGAIIGGGAGMIPGGHETVLMPETAENAGRGGGPSGPGGGGDGASTPAGPSGPAPVPIISTEGQAYLRGKFPALAEAVSGKALPIPPEVAADVIQKAAEAGESVRIGGGKPTDADAAAVKTFTVEAARAMEAFKPKPTAGEADLRGAVEKAGGEWVGVKKAIRPGEEDLALFNDPETQTPLALPISKVTAQNVRLRLDGEEIGPKPPEMREPLDNLVRRFGPPEPAREVTEDDVDRYANVLRQQAMEERGQKTTRMERFIRENGGIAPYRVGENGKKMESEEYAGIPIHLRGNKPYDQMAEMLKDENLLPPDASYTELYSAIAAMPKRGELPPLDQFKDQARNDLENNPDITIQPPPPTDKKSMRRSFRETFGLGYEQADAAAAVADAWAAQWARDTGRSKEEWYKTRIADVRQSWALPGEEEALFQDTDMFPEARAGVGTTYERLVADGITKGMTEKAARKFALDRMGRGQGGASVADTPGQQMMFTVDAVKGFGSGAKGERFLFQDEPKGAIFYSNLQDVLRKKMPEKASVEQVRNILNSQDVKREEVEWSGVDQFLEGKTTLTRAELLNWLRQNEVKVQEVVKKSTSKYNYVGNEWQIAINNAEASGNFDEAERINRAWKGLDETTGSTAGQPKFASYQLPGGENYRELLLTLPVDQKHPEGWSVRNDPEYGWLVESKGGETIQGFTKEEAIANARQRLMNNRQGTGDVFKSAHFEEPNILAHVRFNERTDAEGRKVLFIEEIQSDWHQKGREKGYQGRLPDGWEIKPSKGPSPVFQIHDADGVVIGSGYKTESEAMKDLSSVMKVREDDGGLVPNAPFKKTWHELAMKRVLHWAAEHDFDRVAWTTGEQQADRYDLSKQLDRVDWKRDPKTDQFTIEAFTKGHSGDGDSPAIREAGLSRTELADHLGKDAAQRILDAVKTAPIGRHGLELGELKGDGLKVGGEGMKGFYDKILPVFVNKYTKKWGGRVGEDKIMLGPDEAKLRRAEHGGDSREIADALGGNVMVHSVDITPSMKDAVMEGQPLFQGGGKVTKGATEFMDDFRAIIHGFAKADVSTAFHEPAHIFRRDIYRRVFEAKDAKIKAELHGYVKDLESWVGAKDGIWTKPQEEKFARAFERYMAEGKAPTARLRPFFEKAREWMLSIYRAIKGSDIDVELTPGVRKIFDRMLGGKKGEARGSSGAGPFNPGGSRLLYQNEERRPSPGNLNEPTPTEDAPLGGQMDLDWRNRVEDEEDARRLFEDAARTHELFAEPASNPTRHPPKEVLEAMLNPLDMMKDLALFEQFQVPKEVREGDEPTVLTLPLFGQAGETSTLAPIRAMEVMDGKRFGVMKRNFLFPIHDADMKFQDELVAKKDEVKRVFKGMNAEDREMVFDLIENKERLKDKWPPKNEDKIIRAANFLKAEYDSMLDRLNLARAAIGKDPIKRRANYITHYQELSAIQDIARMVGLNMVDVPPSMLTISAMTKPNSPYFRFAKRRLGEKTDRDAMKAYLTYLEPALRTIHFAPAIKNGRDILEYKVIIPGEYEGATESGKVDKRSLFGIRYPNAYNYLTNYLNRLAGKRDPVDRLFPAAASVAGAMNRLFAAGSIGGNLNTVLTQPASIRNAAAETGLFSIPGYMAILSPRWNRFYHDNSRIAKGRSYEPATKGERMMGSRALAATHDALSTALSVPVGAMDSIMTGGAFLAGYFKAKSLGFSRKEAMRYADDVAERTQASANQVDRPPANAGKIKTSLGQFQTFIYNEWSQIKNDMVKKSIEGEKSRQGYEGGGLAGIREGRDVGLKRFGIYVGVSIALSALYDELKIPNPFKMEGAQFPFIQTPATNWMWERIINQIPGISSVRFGGSPVVKGAINGMAYLVGDERQREAAKRRLVGVGMRLIPGGGQISKTLSGQAVALDSKDAWTKVRALIFGGFAAKESKAKSPGQIKRAEMEKKRRKIAKARRAKQKNRRRG